MRASPVITGIGMITSMGRDLVTIWRRLMAGEHGIGPIRIFDPIRCANGTGGEIVEPLPAHGGERMAALFEIALASSLADAGLRPESLDLRRTILVLGSSFGDVLQTDREPIELDHYVPAALTRLGLDLSFLSVSSACSSGSDAIATGADLLDFAGYEIALCGGVDVLDIYKMVGHSALGTLSATRCTPFSARGDGTSLGEGAAFLVLERQDHATRRGARRRAVLTGRAATTDTHTITSPEPGGAGVARAISQALAGQPVETVTYINAHGSGTALNDAMEARVYCRLFANTRPTISSTKAAFGHTLGATGAIEAAITILALEHGAAPPTVGLEEIHADWRHANLALPGRGAAPLRRGGQGLSVTCGFGGANVALLFALSEEGQT